MDIQIQINVIIKGENMKLTNKEMKNITGGGISYSLINAVTKAITAIYDLGKSTGSAIRRAIQKSYCPLN